MSQSSNSDASRDFVFDLRCGLVAGAKNRLQVMAILSVVLGSIPLLLQDRPVVAAAVIFGICSANCYLLWAEVRGNIVRVSSVVRVVPGRVLFLTKGEDAFDIPLYNATVEVKRDSEGGAVTEVSIRGRKGGSHHRIAGLNDMDSFASLVERFSSSK